METKKTKGMSGGAIAGLISGVVLLLGGIGVGAYFLLKSKPTDSSLGDTTGGGGDTSVDDVPDITPVTNPTDPTPTDPIVTPPPTPSQTKKRLKEWVKAYVPGWQNVWQQFRAGCEKLARDTYRDGLSWLRKREFDLNPAEQIAISLRWKQYIIQSLQSPQTAAALTIRNNPKYSELDLTDAENEANGLAADGSRSADGVDSLDNHHL